MAITPNQDQFIHLAAESDTKTGEVVMLNLLKYKKVAASADVTPGDGGGGEGGSAESGEESYKRYARKALEMVAERGGEVVWMGRPDQVLIGDVDADEWDAVALVRYPSRKAFLDMVSQPDYQKAHTHREGGLERTVLIAMTPADAVLAASE